MGVTTVLLVIIAHLLILIRFNTRRVMGIFSRESQSSYGFLLKILQSWPFLAEVRTFAIRNNGWRDFLEEVSLCDFAILYHSKNRGRVNITDVTDSLYDKELTCLSRSLGKKNVLVVVDDLDSSTAEDKQRILQNQPLIHHMARDLILFSRDKTMAESEMKNIQNIPLEIIYEGVLEKLLFPKKVVSLCINSVKSAVTLLISIPATLLQTVKNAVLSIPARLVRMLESLQGIASRNRNTE